MLKVFDKCLDSALADEGIAVRKQAHFEHTTCLVRCRCFLLLLYPAAVAPEFADCVELSGLLTLLDVIAALSDSVCLGNCALTRHQMILLDLLVHVPSAHSFRPTDRPHSHPTPQPDRRTPRRKPTRARVT
ncbi:hypothetical protein CEP53_015259 [Fusarium sp. AF-6]|nr:hypothetical protein CEP53_015259 [Fusarium sp. AF-6]